ncbi:A/G-specific adenine glycosylase [Buchnera aphidicola (Nipponaphis monzeni)]|uniref:Adenine DNA glycosylase n=1 Tax=Buchnera aphidicola (Nipponaphis monzeni) TaxID=2495405 RepID=A0A455TAT1_9GAMM|nr:A/G-specific adenine glycosylase [Buchnera aphidicola]BBI01424.1 A/G-specific adenine glycosylase [Buchnera aphidicola (Nipponaphis monzeni)]
MIIKTPFSNLIINWYHIYGRKNLPWKKHKHIYLVWISEIMLQQTQVNTVIPYYIKFIKKFPNIKCLANASLNEILSIWSGLGYYKRAHNIYKTIQLIKKEKNYYFPESFEELIKLPGIGKTTAGSILSFSKGYYFSILDTNIKRILVRFYYLKPQTSIYTLEKYLWNIINLITPIYNTDKFNQGILDVGSTICTHKNPKCIICPLKKYCIAYSINDINYSLLYNKKKKIKNKKSWFIIINCKNHVWLEQRKLQKIWNGLFCFPEFFSFKKACQWLKKYQIYNRNLTQNKVYKNYKISNIKLDIALLIINVNYKINFYTKNPNFWFNILKISNISVGMPTFTKLLLQQFTKNHTHFNKGL